VTITEQEKKLLIKHLKIGNKGINYII